MMELPSSRSIEELLRVIDASGAWCAAMDSGDESVRSRLRHSGGSSRTSLVEFASEGMRGCSRSGLTRRHPPDEAAHWSTARVHGQYQAVCVRGASEFVGGREVL